MAGRLAGMLKDVGPRQSRNLLQLLDLTHDDNRTDSRITKWLSDFGFPGHLNARTLSDKSRCSLVLDGIQELCARSSRLPCLLDAALFVTVS